MMNAHKDGWFTETGVPRGSNVSLSVLSEKEQSKYQHIIVFASDIFGRCLAFDNATQCTEMDEFSYQERIAFLPLILHPVLSKVLILGGGGDGGAARLCLKHPLVDRLVQCQIDERVVELSEQYFPSMASSYENPKLELVIGDGYQYIRDLPDESFDGIITDSSNSKAPAGCLFRDLSMSCSRRSLPNRVLFAVGPKVFGSIWNSSVVC